MAKIIDVFRRLRKLSDNEISLVKQIENFTSKQNAQIIKGLIKEKKALIEQDFVSFKGFDSINFPKIIAKDKLSKNTIDNINEKISKKIESILFKSFSQNIKSNISNIVAPNIVGFDYIKKAVALQLFTPDHIHILLLGDPGTGKTQILSSATDLAPISEMGLGSGTSGVGLAITVKGKDIIKGLLPLADKGMCAIDELNLMKEESRASLYNAMEKCFVSYDKGGHRIKFDARISVLATANPKGDKFKGNNTEDLKKQLPFDAALLSRFHLTFLVRKHNINEFKEITKSLLSKSSKSGLSKKEKSFVTDYIRKAHEIKKVNLPKRFETDIVNFIADIKTNEKNYLTEISPRMVVGFKRLAKASARMELRSEVNKDDINLIKSLISESLKI